MFDRQITAAAEIYFSKHDGVKNDFLAFWLMELDQFDPRQLNKPSSPAAAERLVNRNDYKDFTMLGFRFSNQSESRTKNPFFIPWFETLFSSECLIVFMFYACPCPSECFMNKVEPSFFSFKTKKSTTFKISL